MSDILTFNSKVIDPKDAIRFEYKLVEAKKRDKPAPDIDALAGVAEAMGVENAEQVIEGVGRGNFSAAHTFCASDCHRAFGQPQPGLLRLSG